VRRPFYTMITSFIVRREAASAAAGRGRDVFCGQLTDWIKLLRATLLPPQPVCASVACYRRLRRPLNVRISCHAQYLMSPHATHAVQSTSWKIAGRVKPARNNLVIRTLTCLHFDTSKILVVIEILKRTFVVMKLVKAYPYPLQ